MYQEVSNTHISKLAELYVETFNAPPWNDKWTIHLATQRLDEMINCRNSYGLVCYDNDSIVGMIIGNSETRFDGTLFFVNDFFVALSEQGKGIGTALMIEFESRLKGKGIDKTYLFTSKGDKTEQYYKKRGYESLSDMVMMINLLLKHYKH